jgi:phosphatidylethanolamine/phosphatidyl-N-methylethanolamine N-methyltransferase
LSATLTQPDPGRTHTRAHVPQRPHHHQSTVRVKRRFFSEFVRRPGTIGAVAPSSRRLARKMVEGLSLRTAAAIVEFGPGSGVFTREILAHIGPQTRFFAIERNAAMAQLVRDRFPGLTVFEDNAGNIDRLCAGQRIGDARGHAGVDLILSGLPWPSFSDALRTEILEAAARALRPGGQLITFGYHCGLLMPGAWHFRREAKRVFKDMTISEVVWANLPPAFIYRCTR